MTQHNRQQQQHQLDQFEPRQHRCQWEEDTRIARQQQQRS